MKAISKKTYKTLLGLMFLTFGILNFELGGIDSRNFAIIVSFSIVLGGVLIFYGLFIDKTKTANKGEKLMAKTKPKKELLKGNTSVDLMKQEKELEYLLAEVKKQLIEKGWVQKDGVWGIEWTRL